MAESYYEAFQGLLSDDKTSIHVKRFYFIETSYYLNKTVLELQPFSNSSICVLSSNIRNIVSKRMISYARYYNIRDLLAQIYDFLNVHTSVLKDKESKVDMSTTNYLRDKKTKIDGSTTDDLKNKEPKISVATADDLNNLGDYALIIRANKKFYDILISIDTKINDNKNGK